MSASTTTRTVTVKRHVTIPMTKRDSLVMNGSKVSVNSNASNNTGCTEQDFTGNHPDTVAGKKRVKKPVKRTDSYRQATKHQSAVDDLSELKDVHKRDSSSHIDERKKYNTLPLRTDNIINKDISNGGSGKLKRDEKYHELLRNCSQKSGTYPSPDTDEDQLSVQPERRKKSTFKRVKERLLLTFKRDKETKNNRQKKEKNSGPRSRVRHIKNNTKAGYATSDYVFNDNNNIPNKRLHQHTTHDTKGTLGDKSEKERERRELGLFQHFRNSFRGKEGPKYRAVGQNTGTRSEYPPYQNGSPSNTHRTVVGSPSQHPASTSQHSSSTPRHPASDNHPLENNNNTTSASSPSKPIDIPLPSNHTGNPDTSGYEADDTISEIFGSIIDPSCPVSPCSDEDSGFVRHGRKRRADRTPLRLEGLRLCRPGSIGRPTPPIQISRSIKGQSGSHTRTVRADVHLNRSPSVEMDGPGEDQADGVQVQPHGFPEADDGFSVISQEEQQRRIDDVARCLAAIGDRIVADRDSTASSPSDVEGHRVGACPPQTSLERDIMHDLRAFGDDIDQRLFGENGRKLSIGILPIIRNILAAQDYSGFRRVIQRELTDTMGWEQVAWYTYLTKMAICLCGPGRELGLKVKDRAMQYFNTTIKPWVESKPNGWETIHEETDTELD